MVAMDIAILLASKPTASPVSQKRSRKEAAKGGTAPMSNARVAAVQVYSLCELNEQCCSALYNTHCDAFTLPFTLRAHSPASQSVIWAAPCSQSLQCYLGYTCTQLVEQSKATFSCQRGANLDRKSTDCARQTHSQRKRY